MDIKTCGLHRQTTEQKIIMKNIKTLQLIAEKEGIEPSTLSWKSLSEAIEEYDDAQLIADKEGIEPSTISWKSLSEAIEEYDDTQLLCYLHEQIENQGRRQELMEMMIDVYEGIEWTSLQVALKQNRSKEVIFKMMEIGGAELLMMNNEFGYNALHAACWDENLSLDILSKMLEIGGADLLMMTDHLGRNALHFACEHSNSSFVIILKLLEVGGRELLCMAFAWFYISLPSQWHSDNIDISALFVNKCISANIGGEFGIGGLFNDEMHHYDDDKEEEEENHTSGKNDHQEERRRMYDDKNWEVLLPALKSVVDSLQEHQKPPILHAAILAKAPSHVIQDIIEQFEYSILKFDSLKRCPLVLAIRKGLEWSEGLQEIVEATSVSHQQHNIIYTASKYGLKWTNHMKELAEENATEVMNGFDNLTGLRVFMVAAMGDNNDLSSIYGMMRMSPEIRRNTLCYDFDDCSRNKRRRLN